MAISSHSIVCCQAQTISSAAIRIEISSGSAATFISSLSLNQSLVVGGCTGFTPNLLNHADDPSQTKLSGTGITIIDSNGNPNWIRSTGGDVVVANSNLVVIKNISIGGIASEEWFVSVEDTLVTWNISRTFHYAVNLISDRFGALVFMPSFLPTGSAPWSPCVGPSGAVVCAQSQMVSFLDPLFRLNASSDVAMPFPFFVSSAPATASFYEGQSDSQHQILRLSPSQLAFDLQFSNGLFAYGKEGANLVGALVNLGAETVNRSAADPTVRVAAGFGQFQSIQLRLQSDVGVAPLSLDNVGAEITEPLGRFLRSHNVFVGNVYGNSATSVTCYHEVALYPLIQSVLAAPFSDEVPTPWQALQSQLGYIAQHAFNSSGYLYGRWDFQGVEQAGPFDATAAFGCVIDQLPQYILGVYYNAINTGDQQFVQSILPQLKSAASFMLNELQMADGGLLITSCTQGFSRADDPNTRPSNWFDTLAFGHADAFVGVYAVEAFRALAEMCQWVGDLPCSQQFAAVHANSLAAYNQAFWNGKFYSDWIDANGVRRDYMFTWHNLLTIVFGIADDTQARSILSVIDSQRAALISEFALNSTDQLFCTPSNMFPADPNDLLYCNAYGNYTGYPYYENGDCFLLMTGLEYLARSLLGDASTVYESMVVAMSNYNETYFWGQRFSWLSGSMQGNDILTDHLILAWGFLRGAFGIETSLVNGVQVSNPPAKQLEGASHTFVYLGQNARVSIVNGKQQISIVPPAK